MSREIEELIECGNCGCEIPIISTVCPECGIKLYGGDIDQSLQDLSTKNTQVKI